MEITRIFQELGLDPSKVSTGDLTVISPIDGSILGRVETHTLEAAQKMVDQAHQAFLQWRCVPAPKRGELMRLFGQELRDHKSALGHLITLECGKNLAEGLGEVQEMIDICDFSLGLSRQLYGLTMASERPQHRMMETWHPLGVVGVISAFNFPAAVWAWNFSLSIVCGNAVVWKPSEKTPLTALACQTLFLKAAKKFGLIPEGLSQVIIGDHHTASVLVDSSQVPLISATGSCSMGAKVGPRVIGRFGRVLLELGGNNAMIVCPSADLNLAVRAIVFSAVGTAGQRCTSLRRLIVHKSIKVTLMAALKKTYVSVSVGHPAQGNFMGPLIDERAFQGMQHVLDIARQQGGIVFGGERVPVSGCEAGYYVHPALVEIESQQDVVKQETFAPILYVMTYETIEEAIAIQNDVDQGLSSSIFTNDLREAETFLSAWGSDCGIANVNIGTSGAEIGGAFGGEKHTGGGRESGSDAWKSYMRRATNTLNFSSDLPLAQGIKF